MSENEHRNGFVWICMDLSGVEEHRMQFLLVVEYTMHHIHDIQCNRILVQSN